MFDKKKLFAWKRHVNFNCTGKKEDLKNLHCPFCDVDFDKKLGYTRMQREKMYDEHYCEVAERNTGHFPKFEIIPDETFRVKKVIESDPYDAHLGCKELNICVPGTYQYFIVAVSQFQS